MTDINKQYKIIQEMLCKEPDQIWKYFQMATDRFLLRVVKRNVDLNAWARFELCSRGYNLENQNVGKKVARTTLKVNRHDEQYMKRLQKLRARIDISCYLGNTTNDFLIRVVAGEVDLNLWAEYQMACRCITRDGKKVTASEAFAHYGVIL